MDIIGIEVVHKIRSPVPKAAKSKDRFMKLYLLVF